MLPARLLCLPVLEDRLALVGVWLFPTRSYAALRAADLDWIVGPGYSLGRVHSGEKP